MRHIRAAGFARRVVDEVGCRDCWRVERGNVLLLVVQLRVLLLAQLYALVREPRRFINRVAVAGECREGRKLRRAVAHGHRLVLGLRTR